MQDWALEREMMLPRREADMVQVRLGWGRGMLGRTWLCRGHDALEVWCVGGGGLCASGSKAGVFMRLCLSVGDGEM